MSVFKKDWKSVLFGVRQHAKGVHYVTSRTMTSEGQSREQQMQQWYKRQQC
jgi:hypothetical protein